MSKKTKAPKTTKNPKLQTLTAEDLQAVTGGGACVPGQYRSSSGGGSTGC